MSEIYVCRCGEKKEPCVSCLRQTCNDLRSQLAEAREEALKYKIKYNNQSSDILRLKQSKKDQTELIRKLKDEKK